jgi:hypothetical protein
MKGTLKQGNENWVLDNTDCNEISNDEKSLNIAISIRTMVASALEYNPRRIKQFKNLFRLHTYLGRKTDLFFQKNASDPRWNCTKLAKFLAISIGWPSLIFTLNSDPTLLNRLEEKALDPSKKVFYTDEYEKVKKWAEDERLNKLLKEGLEDKKQESVAKYSLSGLDFSKILAISPLDPSSFTKTFTSSNNIQSPKIFISSTASMVGEATANAKVLQVNNEEE